MRKRPAYLESGALAPGSKCRNSPRELPDDCCLHAAAATAASSMPASSVLLLAAAADDVDAAASESDVRIGCCFRKRDLADDKDYL